MNISFDEFSTCDVRKPRDWDGTMRFGVFWPYSRTLIPSASVSARNPDVLDMNNHLRFAQAIETAGLDFILVADGYAPGSEAATNIGFQDPRLHAILWAVPLILGTRRLGIVSTIHTSYLHPVQIARFAAHLDHMSGGRWGWNIVNGFRDHEARLFGLDGLPDHDAAYEMADESISIIEKLWSGIPVEHVGAKFKVSGRIAGPLPTARPLLVCAASSGRGRAFTAAHCDYLFASLASLDGLPKVRSELAELAGKAQRQSSPEILAFADLLIREEPGRAQEEYTAMTQSVDADAEKAWVKTLANTLMKLAPQVNSRPASSAGILPLVGTAAEVAEQIISLRETVGLNGILFRMLLWDFSEAQALAPMLSILRKAGVWKPPCERGHSW
jgi:dimethylsulfone monooxygenase